MKVILGICTYNKEQENIAKNYKIPVVCKKENFKTDIEIFNHLFTETNKLCELWDDVVVIINGCTIPNDFQATVRKFFELNYQLNIIDIVPENIKKKIIKFKTTSTLSGYDLKVTDELFNRFDIKIMRHFIYNLIGGINEKYVLENKLEKYAHDIFNYGFKLFDNISIGKTVFCDKLDKNVKTVNNSIKSVGYFRKEIIELKDVIQIYKKMDV